MNALLARVFEFGFGALAACGCGYYVLCLFSARSFLLDVRKRPKVNFTPPVSILKPLRGTDRHMMDCFRSHCRQDYPDYEIIFGVSASDDPAVALVEQLKLEFPKRRIELVHCAERLGTNLKVSNLVQMLPHARFGHLIINDSDILVGTEYVRNTIAPFHDHKTGMVTAPYRGAAGRTVGSKLEGLGISTDFIPGVLAATVVDGRMRFGLGSTLAINRESLEAVGGFEPLLDYLADDYELGKRIANAGLHVILSSEVVDTFLPDYTVKEYWDHQLRWMRSIRTSRPGGYAGLIFTFGLPFALATVIAARGQAWSLLLLVLAAVLRYGVAYRVGLTLLRDGGLPRLSWLISFRDVFALVLWAAAYLSDTVTWRGDEFKLRDGKLTRVCKRSVA